jgi:UDP-glucuronate 4-epimerase
MKILITGTAGFIGFHLANELIKRGDEIVGLDCINSYYDVDLKYDRLAYAGIEREEIAENVLVQSKLHANYRFIQLKLEDRENLHQLFAQEKFDKVLNLAAQAGVRYSLENPYTYIDSNITGFINILEACRHHQIKHLVYASSSSVYGLNKKQPFSVNDSVDHPISLYAATKKSNELMAHTYSYLFGVPTTGLRFFTVYGPWGRPDMAVFLFTKAITEGKPVNIFNNGEMSRDFTYIDDIVQGIILTLDNTPLPNADWNPETNGPSTSIAPYRVCNIGNSKPEKLMDYIAEIEKNLGKPAIRNYLPMQPGDVPSTWADVEDLKQNFGYSPKTDIRSGVKNFVEWFKQYYSIKN